jgi:4-amino-4-deoxy-L-arabinose transferase-like glycosyltransferase
LWKPTWNIRITRWTLLVILVAALVVFFRAYRLDSVLGEMFSDHAEKLLDVMDVLNGKYSIFFPRNTGREAIQFYLSAGIATLFNTGISFLTLKLGTMLIGLATLPCVYLLGKEVANKWVGLTAFFLTGVAYWANLIARIGLRFPLYPCFAAPTLYFLIRGIRRSNRNDFILAGIALGLGLHGYSPARFLPFVVVAAVIIYLLHKQSKGNRKEVIVSLVILALVSFVVFLPLFRYWVDNPDMFGYRAFSRLGSTERPLPGPILAIFFSNTWKAMIMPFFDNGNIWVHSIPGRPALDFISAALFMLGLVVVIARYIKKRDWVDLFLLISIPLLLMPSILSLAFPDENPSLNRTGAAYIPIFIIAAMGLDGALAAIKRSMSNWIGTALTGVVAFGLVLGICFNNYNLVFNQFEKQFMEGALDTTDIGAVIHEFATTVGARDSAFVVPYPYWVDTRLVGIHAGFPDKDYALWPDGFKDTQDIKGAKLFIFNPEDTKDIQALQQQYPSGILTRFKTKQDGKDFMMLFVPPEKAK